MAAELGGGSASCRYPGQAGAGGDLPRSEGAPIPESPGGDTPPHPLLGLTALRRNRTAWLDSISHLPAGLFWVQIWGIRSEREEPQSVSPDLLPDCWLSPSPSSPLCTSSAVTLSSCPQNTISNSGEVTEGPWAQEGAQGLRPIRSGEITQPKGLSGVSSQP